MHHFRTRASFLSAPISSFSSPSSYEVIALWGFPVISVESRRLLSCKPAVTSATSFFDFSSYTRLLKLILTRWRSVDVSKESKVLHFLILSREGFKLAGDCSVPHGGANSRGINASRDDQCLWCSVWHRQRWDSEDIFISSFYYLTAILYLTIQSCLWKELLVLNLFSFFSFLAFWLKSSSVHIFWILKDFF